MTKTYGQMNPEERRLVRQQAVDQLNAELNHPAMRAALAAPIEHTYENCSHRPDFASAAEHDRDCPAMVRGESLGGQ